MIVSCLHHVAVICSDYQRSREFYVNVLGLRVIAEVYRAERQSYKLNLEIPGGGEIELFSFPSPPTRLTRPEACGLRHLAFGTVDFDASLAALATRGVLTEKVRVDEHTGSRFTFLTDPDGLPIEIYEGRVGE